MGVSKTIIYAPSDCALMKRIWLLFIVIKSTTEIKVTHAFFLRILNS